MYDIVYCGYSEVMLRHLLECPDINLCGVLTVQRRINEKFIEILQKHELNYFFIETKKEMIDQLRSYEKVDCVVIYKFEFIIPEEIVRKGVFVNLHGGDLRTNRGANPTVWSILKKEKETCLSLYRLTGGIDEGELICSYKVPIDIDETSVTLDHKLAEGIPSLLSKLLLYLQGKIKGRLITGGCYRRRITEDDFTIDLENDTLEDVSAKIRSQKAYYGAILNYEGKRYRVHDIISAGLEDEHADTCFLTVPVGAETVILEVSDEENV